jgi:ornithine cyclodeaminase/alanine dehydrogenase-like protein (mu-crystallin family)
LLDNGYLTDVRAGIAGSIACQYLAQKRIDTTGAIGSGTQVRYQMRGVKLVRDFNRLMIFGILPEEVDLYVDEMSEELGVKVIKASRYEQVVRESDIVVTSTPSNEPYLRAEWLHPGLRITCMGSDVKHKQELHADVFSQENRVVYDRKSQCFRLGELHHALEAGVISESDEIIEIDELISSQKSRRQSDDEITIYDLTGVGV